MPWARASALHRHLECPAASHLPMFDRGAWHRGYLQRGFLARPDLKLEPWERTPEGWSASPAAGWGIAMHAAMADAPDACDPWTTWVTPHRERLWPARLGRHEVSVALDCRTRRYFEFFSALDSERDEWKRAQSDDCVVGTADWWAHLPTGEPWVDDLKTGWAPPDVVTAQTLFYALAHFRLNGAGNDTARISVTHWPRAKEPTEPRRSWRQVSSVLLDDFEDDVIKAWRRAVGPDVLVHGEAPRRSPGYDPAPRPGAHCQYCPSADVCSRANG